MSETEPELDDFPDIPADGGPSVGPERAPDEVDTSPTEEDGPQDVDQDPGYEEAESDEDEDDDPEIHEVA